MFAANTKMSGNRFLSVPPLASTRIRQTAMNTKMEISGMIASILAGMPFTLESSRRDYG